MTNDPAIDSHTGTPLWHSQAHMPSVMRDELVLVRGEGAYVWDATGRRLLDVPASLWYANIGHGRAEIAAAVAAQMRELETYSTFGRFATLPALELAGWVSEHVPLEQPKVFLTSGGGDSVDTAAKLARRYWHAMGAPDKQVILTRERAYHGLHGFGTSITGLAANLEGLGPLIQHTERVPTSDVAAVRKRFEDEHDRIAALFVEPVIGTGGVILPEPGYLQAIEQLCRDYDVLFIVDEVITGFGRTGEWFACDRFGLNPDILLLAKGITSGYMPLGAVVISRRVWEPFWRDGSDLVFRHGITYSGHASACVAALRNIEILRDERLVENVAALGELFTETLKALARAPLVKEVRAGVGFLAGVELEDAAIAERVARAALDHGLLLRVISNTTLQVSPPLVVSSGDIAFLARGLEAALNDVQTSG